MSSIKSKASLVLELPPSCVEFWPQFSEWAVVGTYYLERNESQAHGNTALQTNEGDSSRDSTLHEQMPSQQRSGSLVLLKVERDNM
jgi:diphthine methyl ester acylhydrolase